MIGAIFFIIFVGFISQLLALLLFDVDLFDWVIDTVVDLFDSLTSTSSEVSDTTNKSDIDDLKKKKL